MQSDATLTKHLTVWPEKMQKTFLYKQMDIIKHFIGMVFYVFDNK